MSASATNSEIGIHSLLQGAPPIQNFLLFIEYNQRERSFNKSETLTPNLDLSACDPDLYVLSALPSDNPKKNESWQLILNWNSIFWNTHRIEPSKKRQITEGLNYRNESQSKSIGKGQGRRFLLTRVSVVVETRKDVMATSQQRKVVLIALNVRLFVVFLLLLVEGL
ncbi:8653_t:CDS:2 [Acaulospora morrowiae]|uniref:8653_t:CDS:1 n=1 Tax=Acaulospora morrowiae TaxID=94023 RepID=A0A9N9F7N5_9GLOM|nr:8653_t:CDS:2 [Acaulospora morrowiae]